MPFRRLNPLLLLLTLVGTLALAPFAQAEPSGRLLRIDPRASLESGAPIITTLIETSQHKRVSDAIMHCATLTGKRRLSCMSDALEKPSALYTSLPFPEKNAILTVEVEGLARPASFISKSKWGDSTREPGVGTAWLILVDADRRMGKGLQAARELAGQFVASLGPNDIVNLMFFNDRQVVRDSKWLPASKTAAASRLIDSIKQTFPSQGRNRALLTILKTAATDAFRSLGNTGSKLVVPMHQAMVVLSSGYGGTDPSTSGPGALQLQQYMTAGRFPPDNTALPKSPVPVISIYFPHRTYDEFRNNSLDFMQNLANPEIGGFFSVVQAGEGGRSASIVRAVRTRFSRMHIVKWRVSCLAPKLTQTFALAFRKVNPPLSGDASFKDIPLGIDPTDWPLDIDLAQTRTQLKGGIYPGGKFRVFGNFCWRGDRSRAEAYFLPAGSAPPTDLDGSDIAAARRAQKQLIAQGMRAEVVDVSDAFADFIAPESEKIMHGSGPRAVSRIVLYDNRASRTSGVTADTILELPATTAPFPLLWALAALFAITVIALLSVVLVRSGRRSPDAPNASRDRSAPRPGHPSSNKARSHTRGSVHEATLQGAAGVFSIPDNTEVSAGRNEAKCVVLLTDTSVSGVHATLKIEDSQLWVRDEASNNGTFVGGTRLQPGKWSAIPNGAELRFGPVEFSVRLS